MHYTRCESGKETLWWQTLKNWRRWTHLNSTPEGSTQRKCFPVADGTVKIFRGEQLLRTSTLTRDRSERGEKQEIQGKSDELHFPTRIQEDSTRDEEEAKSDFWTITGGFIYRHLVVPRVKLYVPKEKSFPVPLKYIDATRTTCTSLDVLLEKILQMPEFGWRKRNCQMHGQASQD